nr:hypothetical protein [Tanacetum cinerariifolium]
MARRRKRLGAGESRPEESRTTKSRPTESMPTESRPTKSTSTESRPRVDMARRRKRLGVGESRPTESRPTESRPTESRPRVGEGQSNDIPNNATVNDNTDETTTENTTENLNNPSNGRTQVQFVNGLFDKSSECSREITKIFKEKIDDTGYTWTKVSQPTKNFYFGEFKTRVRKAWDAKAFGRYADFFRDIRAKMLKPIFMSDSSWINFTSHWATSKYKEIQEKNTQNRLKGESSSTHTGGSISFREHANNLESIYKRPPTGFELFLHTHTSGHDKITFINEKSKTIHDNVLRLRQEREGNQAYAESQLDETTLYIEAASGAKKRNLYGAGSKRVDYIKDKYSRNETTGTTTVNDGWEKKSMKMERKLNKLNKTLKIVCNRFNITLPDCDSDSENTDGGDAHQGPNTSNSRAGESNSRAGEREENDHDSRMIVSS